MKIGHSTRPYQRVHEIELQECRALEVLALRLGGEPRERAYHKQFAEFWIAGEWFEKSPEIEAEIAKLSELPADKAVCTNCDGKGYNPHASHVGKCFYCEGRGYRL